MAHVFAAWREMASRNTSFQLLLLFFLALVSRFYHLEAAGFNPNVGCIEMERRAPLKLKDGLIDPFGRLYSWIGKDCCNWSGVGCSNQTGNVIMLDLSKKYDCPLQGGDSPSLYQFCQLYGTLNPSLLNLTHLNYLDVSYNNFLGIPIPNFIGSLKNLMHLEMNWANFFGMFPPHLGNLSNLVYLDLETGISDSEDLWVTELEWLSILSSLHYLNLRYVNLSKASTTWLKAINMLPSSLELYFSSCQLYDLPQTLPFVNFTSLQNLDLSLTSSALHCHTCFLDLSSNSVEGESGELIGTLSRCSNGNLETLDFSTNNLAGNLPDFLWSLENLMSLVLYSNKFTGKLSEVPGISGEFVTNGKARSSFNTLSGTITEGIGQLPQLFQLGLYGNSIEGVITELHFQNLTYLSDLSLSSTNKSLVFRLRDDWIPPLQLDQIAINDCQLGPAFPPCLRTQIKLSQITLSNVGISDTIPDWFWRLVPTIWLPDLSYNQLRGMLPKSMAFTFEYRGHEMSLLQNLNLSGNFLNGSIPPSINNMMNLNFLDLSSNQLTGTIPRQWQGLQYLMFLDLSKNNLSGDIPSSMCSLATSENFAQPLQVRTLNTRHDIQQSHGVGHQGKRKCIYHNNSTYKQHRPVQQQYSGRDTRGDDKSFGLWVLESLLKPTNGKNTINFLNLSYNNLSGPIPSSNQLQTIGNPSTYEGNPGLCGPPFSISCTISSVIGPSEDNDGDRHIKLQFYISAVVGFLVGFWATFGTLVIKKSIRHAYYRFLDKNKDELSVLIAVNVARLRRKNGMARN
ncbi:receptor-like protein kinase 5 [Durio zibethinus]|uniref:Receptor-like protein kinase 5 n=1 Tax=Durio zibethinus TaxID=66656 RepID=A0A6P5Y5C4_DURZI|nr:receptor-like protein kinase 5 [Durio zibethinus]